MKTYATERLQLQVEAFEHDGLERRERARAVDPLAAARDHLSLLHERIAELRAPAAQEADNDDGA